MAVVSDPANKAEPVVSALLAQGSEKVKDRKTDQRMPLAQCRPCGSLPYPPSPSGHHTVAAACRSASETPAGFLGRSALLRSCARRGPYAPRPSAPWTIPGPRETKRGSPAGPRRVRRRINIGKASAGPASESTLRDHDLSGGSQTFPRGRARRSRQTRTWRWGVVSLRVQRCNFGMGLPLTFGGSAPDRSPACLSRRTLSDASSSARCICRYSPRTSRR